MIYETLNSLSCRNSAGFTYVGVLFAVALMGVTLALIATMTSQTQQREKEKQLLFIGSQVTQAIGSYYNNAPPGQVRQFPKRLEDLLEDSRAPHTLRHLRRIYYDPFTSGTDWGLVRDANQGIIGIYSKSDTKPIKVANFDREYAQFERAKHYSDWKFIYTGGQPLVANARAGESTPVIPQPEIIPPEYTAPLSPIARPNTPEDRKKRLCDNIHSADLHICYTQSKQFGEAVGATCLASATRRYAACQNGAMLSPLVVQYNK